MDESENSRNKVKEFIGNIKTISEKLELTDEQKIIGIDSVKNMSLGGNLERNSVYVVKIKDKDGSIHHIVIDKLDENMNKIATIDKEGKIELSDKEKELWETRIGKPGHQRPDQKSLYDFDKEYILEEYKTTDRELENDKKENVGNDAIVVPSKKEKSEDKKEEEKSENKKEEEKSENKKEKEAAKSLGVDENAILCVVKIEDRDAFGRAINRNLKSDAYIVKYGNNKIKIMETTTGSLSDLKEVSGLEYSEFTGEVLEQLNMPTQGKDLKIRPGDLKTIKDDEKGCSYVVVRESDPDKGIVIVTSPTGVQTYTFDDRDRDSVEELEESIVYAVETGKDEVQEEKLENDDPVIPEEEEEVGNDAPVVPEKEEEDEGRTPWGDAYARQRR